MTPGEQLLRPLDARQRAIARQAAESQAPDPAILGSLRAEVYETTEPGLHRDTLLSLLEAMHPDDTRELDAFRDRGRVRLHMVMMACAMAYALNDRKERYDPELHGPWEDMPQEMRERFAEVDPKAAGMAQYCARLWLAIDPAVLREEAGREAQRFAELGTQEMKAEVLTILPMLGLSQEMTATVGRAMGLTVVDGGKTG